MGAGNKIVSLTGLVSLAMAHATPEKRASAADGTIYTKCVKAGQVALTFDDGPHIYTQQIVDSLTKSGHKATFFQNGQNYGSIYDYGGVLQSMLAGGHQIASHTWSHKDLATLDAAGVRSEMTQLEAAHQSLIGKAPKYMRPPYLSLDADATAVLVELGYKIVSISIDTLDYVYGPKNEIQLSVDWFIGNYTEGGSIVLNHDPFKFTAEGFVPKAIEYLNSKGLKSVTIGECLGDPESEWYKQSSATGPKPSGSATPPKPSGSATPPSPSGSGSPAPPKPSGYAPGNDTAPYPGDKPGSGYPGKGYGGDDKYGPGKGYQDGKPGCGDTEPGHGPNSGRGALPGKSGEGNKDHSGLKANNATGTTPDSGYSKPGHYSNTTAPIAKPTYEQSNGAATLTASVVVMLGAAIAMLL